jgi:LEA14-like dessication related protein
VFLVLVVLVAAVGTAYVLGAVGTPSVVAVENRFGEVTNETTEVETDLVVSNPNPVGVTLGGTTVDYTVRMNGVAMAGGLKDGLSVEQGNSTLPFTTRMRNERIPDWWVTHIRDGENTTVTVDATVTSSALGNRSAELEQRKHVETDLIGAFRSRETRPVNASQPLVSDPVLYVNRTTAAWGDVTEARTPIDTSFLVYNPKTVPYAITEVGYTITMNGIVVGEGASDREYLVEGRTTENVSTTTAIRNERLDEWWVSHLRNDQVTDLRIDFYARIELPGGAEVRVPLDALTYERTVETDVFGTKESTNGTGGSERTDGDASTATPSPASGTARTSSPPGTPTASPSPTAAEPTATPTPTDDGGLLGGTPAATPSPVGSTPTATSTSTPAPTDDGGLLALSRAGGRLPGGGVTNP